jgi:cytochrome c oxidase assembly protein subunit 15
MTGKPALKRYNQFARYTIALVYLVILAGGIVRSTGSGMGCPDWPKCFGLLVPPTNASQLPLGYQDKYQVEGHAAEFNVFHTWTEYLNRLVGAISGLFVIWLAYLSLSIRKELKWVTIISFGMILLFGFQAWLGKIVVDSYLSPLKITIHMLLAFVILLVLLALEHLSASGRAKPMLKGGAVQWVLAVLGILVLIQVLIGTQVREEIDHIANALAYQGREQWVSLLGDIYNGHRLLGFSIVGITAYLVWFAESKEMKGSREGRLLFLLAGFVFLEMALGMILGMFGMPPWAQPLHLLFSSFIFGLIGLLLLPFWFSKSPVANA